MELPSTSTLDFKMKKLFSLLLASVLYSQCCPPVGTCAPKTCAYLPSASDCTDWNLSVDFLYWEAMERGLEYAVQNRIEEPSFGFNPAFRITLGTHLPHDAWDLDFSYTQYNAHTSKHTSGSLQSVWTSPFSAVWSEARAKWKLHTHCLNLQLKNCLFMSQAISIEPAFGLNLALIQQRFDVLYENSSLSSRIGMKNRSFNLGPIFSMNSCWSLSSHFDVLGVFSGCLLASRFDVGRHESGAVAVIEGNEYWAMRPQATVALGLGWSDCATRSNRMIHYGLEAFYEAQVWWKQNMLYRFIDQTNTAMIAPTQGDLFFHGLTVEGYVHF